MPIFTHKPTRLPDAGPDRDRVVLCDGVMIGRVFEIDSGPRAGQWRWAGYWIGHGNAGTADNLAGAPAEIKTRATPEAIEDCRSRVR